MKVLPVPPSQILAALEGGSRQDGGLPMIIHRAGLSTHRARLVGGKFQIGFGGESPMPLISTDDNYFLAPYSTPALHQFCEWVRLANFAIRRGSPIPIPSTEIIQWYEMPTPSRFYRLH